MDALECLHADEIFTHTDDDEAQTVRHFNTSAMARAIRDRKLAPGYNTVTLYKELVISLMENHGVELVNVQRILLDNDRLAVPIFVALFPPRAPQPDPPTLIIDGAHRVVARWMRGLRDVDALFFTPEQWAPFLVDGFNVPHQVSNNMIVTPLAGEAAEDAIRAGLVKRPVPTRIKF